MSYARLSKWPLLFRSFTGLERSEFDSIYVDNDDDNKPITLIVDASGLTITKKGDYSISISIVEKTSEK